MKIRLTTLNILGLCMRTAFNSGQSVELILLAYLVGVAGIVLCQDDAPRQSSANCA